MGIALALNLCGRVSIFGFSWDTTYYFDKVHLPSRRGPWAKNLEAKRRRKGLPAQPDRLAPEQRTGKPSGASNTHQWRFEHQCTQQFGQQHPCVTLWT